MEAPSIEALPPGSHRYAAACRPELLLWVASGYPRAFPYRRWQDWRARAQQSAFSNAELAVFGLADRWFLFTELLNRQDVYQYGPKSAEWLYNRCREVEAEPDDRLDLWARTHYKSSLITFAGVIQDALREPELTQIIFSHTVEQAQRFLQVIKEELEMNERLKEIYADVLWSDPGTQAPRWGIEKGLVLKRQSNPKESSIDAGGLVNGMPTGGHWQKRIYDDLVTEKSVTTPEMIDKSLRAFELSQFLGTPEGGRSQMIGTRYHFGDAYQTLINQKIVQPRLFPATSNGRLDGEPVFLSEEAWAKAKRKSPKTVAAQMLQNPLAGSETVFDHRWFQSYTVRPLTLNVAILVDPSKGINREGADRDRTAMIVLGIDTRRNFFLLDGIRHRIDIWQRWRALKVLVKRWRRAKGVRSVVVGYEQYGMQADAEVFRELMIREKMPLSERFTLQEVAWPRSGPHAKADRIERLVPDIRDGHFRVPAFIKEPGIGRCTWSFDDSGIVLTPAPEPTEEEREAKQRGLEPLVIQPIVRLDESGTAYYDLTKVFLEELAMFPFSTHEDAIDAASRVYDLIPGRPREEPERRGDRRSSEPEHYMDV